MSATVMQVNQVKPGRILWYALRERGFRRTWDTSAGGERMVEYTKQIDERRTLSMQIWYGGTNRISSSFVGCGDTAPTEFASYVDMDKAILHESTRMDGKYAFPGTTALEAAAKRWEKKDEKE